MLLEQPELNETLQEEWEAFCVLDRGRQWGFNGPQPILVSEIESYCRLNRIDGETEREDLVSYLQEMDAAYLKWHREKDGN
jgi:hypothetical protein